MPEPENGSVEETKEDKCLDLDEIRKNLMGKFEVIVDCFDQEKLSKREAVLLVIIFIIGATAVSVGLIVGDIMKERDDCLIFNENVTTRMNAAEMDMYVREICLEDVCVRKASQMMYDLDTSVTPCTNFYKYACGGWVNSNPVPTDQKVWGVRQKVEYAIRDKIRARLESPLDRTLANRLDSAVRKMTVLYKSCMDEETIDKAGTSMIWDAITKIGGWAMQGGRSNWDITDGLSKLHFSYSSDALFYPFVAPNPYDRKKYVIQIAKSGLGIPNAADYSDPNKSIVQAYKEYMMTVARELGQGDPNRVTFAQQVFEVEKDLSEIITLTDTNQGGYENTTIEELQTIAGQIEWIKYFTAAGFAVNKNTKVLVASKEYLKRVFSMVSRVEKSKLNNYFVWKLAMSLAMDLPKEFRDAASTYVMAMSGTTTPKPRWEYCFNSVDSYMGLALGAVYIKHHFRNKTKEQVTWMVDEFQATMKETIENSDWLEESAKEKSSSKIDSLVKKIGYPKILESEAKLDDYYKYINIWFGDAYSKILTNIMQGQTNKMIQLLHEPVDPDEWAIGLHSTNAYYSAIANEIVLPAGLLTLPFFDENNLQFINYAGTGFVIGHELMHAFDNKGDLSMAEVWGSSNYTEAYDAKKTCLTGYLTRQGIKDSNQAKAHILQEEMADLDGLATAFRAYRSWSWKQGGEKVLPGMQKTADQLFFISYAQSWCESTSPEGRKGVSNGNIPSDLRVRAAVSHSKDFATAFDCSHKSQMNVQPKCTMW
ncbi:endothelin-converting enzyme 1-like isoform X2 [Lineus longissimus]|uniref:endothelin-converting enzyme 1-like isoform X2 n=1 Tax=Lineus longissimus TaxID=88925 RepID=UPI002B4D8FDB